MLKAFVFSILFTLANMFMGCQNSYEFWDISKFKMDSLALSDNEPIRLLYTSRGPDNNKALTYYIHIVAVSEKSGDTVNILTTIDNGFTADDEGKIYNFFDHNNIATKISHSDYDNLADANKIEEIQQAGLKKINKVARDPKFDDIADNTYQTVIGSIGIVKLP